jgi:hypothetical protein
MTEENIVLLCLKRITLFQPNLKKNNRPFAHNRFVLKLYVFIHFSYKLFSSYQATGIRTVHNPIGGHYF